MKGNEQVIECMNSLLADELTAINQYMVHAELCDNWGYERLHDAVQERAVTEMKHAERLISRMIFLDGQPIVSLLREIRVGSDVPKQLQSDWNAEYGAVKAYNDGVRLCREVGDNGTRALMESILQDEEGHIDWIETQQEEIAQMGLPDYLGEQTED